MGSSIVREHLLAHPEDRDRLMDVLRRGRRLWDELPDWVLTYGAGGSGASFPNDKTSDQWFNEAQFAAYTELGRRIAVKARTVPSYEEYPVPPGSTTVD